jgi:UDP-glucose 4-epimerase
VLPTFVQQALANQPITVFEDGAQSRAFLDVEDLVRFIVEHGASDGLANGKCVNVGNPENACTIVELAERTKTLLSSTSTIRFVSGSEIYGPEYVEAASRHKLCDIGRAFALGWRPRRSLDEIIMTVAEHYSRHRDMRDSDARDAGAQVDAGRRTARG